LSCDENGQPEDLEQADHAARAVISLTKAIIGKDLSKKIAQASPPDLREGWESIEQPS